MAKKIAGVLAGCGYLDGAEIQEAVLTLLALEKRGAKVSWFAPAQPQAHVVNHISGQPAGGESRNVLVESARIVRGDIHPLSDLDMADFDGLVLPGGFGAAKNLCSFAFDGAAMKVLPALEAQLLKGHSLRRPMAFLCIAPVIAARVLGAAGARPKVTIGSDKATILAIQGWGAQHQACAADEICLDTMNLLVSTPAWNEARTIVQVAAGIEKLGERLCRMI
jgi:enhancing lycopene biosynthesis protein 2